MSTDSEFEASIAEALSRRADSLEVHQNLGLLQLRSKTTQARLRIVQVAAVILLIGGLIGGFLLVASQTKDGEEIAVQATFEQAFAAGRETTNELGQDEAILWLQADASDSEIEAVRQWLASNPNIEEYHYVNRAETYSEFRMFYADKPEILELVEPEQMPTSFVVSTNYPDVLLEAERRFSAVDAFNQATEP